MSDSAAQGHDVACQVHNANPPWALRASRPPFILRELLRGAEPVCVDCRRPLAAGEPKVTVPNRYSPALPWWRCGDCEYEAAGGQL